MIASPLSTQDLFTPMPSGVGPFGQVPVNPGSATWLGTMLTIAAQVQLPTTSWQSGAPERTIFAVQAVTFQQSDVNVSLMAQGGFLQSAASGSVTFTTVQGVTVTVPVTPDPSNSSQNPTGALGYLDLLSQNVYAVTRLDAQQAIGPLALVNLSASSIGPYAAGTYHVANTQTGATYNNPSSLTIPTSTIAGSGGQINGVSPGFSSTIVSTVSAHGLLAGQVVYLVLPVVTGITIFPGNATPGSGFATVTAVTATTFEVQVGSSGTYVSGGTAYLPTVATMQADVAGIVGNAGPFTVTTNVTQNAGVFISNVVGWSGSNWESNTALMNRCVLSLANRSPNGPSQAYVYFAETASQILAQQVAPWNAPPYTNNPPYTLTNGPCQATEFANPQTGIVTTMVASATPVSTVYGANVTPGCAQLAITGVSNASPCVISCGGAHGLTSGMNATLSFPPGAGAAALISALTGSFVVTVTSATSFSIAVNTTSLGAWVAGGEVEGGDLGAIDELLQSYVVPDGITAVTQSAQALPVQPVATVIVPQAYVAAYRLAVGVQLAAQFASYSIGGDAPSYAVAYDDIVGALEEAGVLAVGQASYVRQVQSLSLNGLGAGVGVPFPSTSFQAVLNNPLITVLGV